MMLVQRCKRWPSTKPALFGGLVGAGYICPHDTPVPTYPISLKCSSNAPQTIRAGQAFKSLFWRISCCCVVPCGGALLNTCVCVYMQRNPLHYSRKLSGINQQICILNLWWETCFGRWSCMIFVYISIIGRQSFSWISECKWNIGNYGKCIWHYVHCTICFSNVSSSLNACIYVKIMFIML